jgi:deoxyribose-phosphate aldolase
VKLTAEEIAGLIDISAVRAQHGESEIRAMVESAKQYRFCAVHVLPCWMPLLRELLAGSPHILAGAPVGFPGGGHRTEIKVAEARALISDGVQEMDVMLNVGKLRSGDRHYVEEEIRTIVGTAGEVPVKVIIEAPLLNHDEILAACDACMNAGASFIKTSTGWVADGSTLPIIRLIKSHVGRAISIKAAGGIRDVQTVVDMYRLGVARFGINLDTAVQIVSAVSAMPGSAIEVA